MGRRQGSEVHGSGFRLETVIPVNASFVILFIKSNFFSIHIEYSQAVHYSKAEF